MKPNPTSTIDSGVCETHLTLIELRRPPASLQLNSRPVSPYHVEMALRADGVRLAHPRDKRGVDVARVGEAKRMEVVLRRERLDRAEPRVLETARENDVTVEPSFPRRDLRERHTDLERDACLLRENGDGA